MTDAAVTLTAEEWEKAMAFVLAAKEDEKESVKGQKPPTKRRPAYMAPVKALDTGDGGDKWNAVMPPSGSNTTLTETPSTGPSGTSDTSTPPAEKWATRIGTPSSTGKPAGSMAAAPGDGWSSTTGTPQGTTKTMWNGAPPGKADGSGPSGDPTTSDTLNKAPGTYGSHEDLHTTPGGEASLPDGSFMCVTAADVGILVDKVKAADERNPRPTTHPWWVEVKAHLARRAASLGVSALIPSGW